MPPTDPLRRRILLAVAALLVLAQLACGQLPLCSSYECVTYGCTICEGGAP
jgi:hypothetical protein